MGDSLSAAYGLPANTGWVTLLKDRLMKQNYDVDVINMSVSGNTTSNGLTALPDALKKYRPSITVIELGGNDALRGIQLATIEKNLTEMTNLALGRGSKVIILGVRIPPNYGEDYAKGVQEVFFRVAKLKGVILVPLFLNGIDNRPSLMQADRIHPSKEAQLIMLENIWPALKAML